MVDGNGANGSGGVISSINRMLMVAAGIALCGMMLHTTLNVLGTQLFGVPIDSTLEFVAYYYMLAVVFLPLGALVDRIGGLVRVDLLEGWMSPAVRKWTIVLGFAATALFSGWAAITAWKPAMAAYQFKTYVGTLVHLEIWPPRFVLVAGFGWLCVVAVARMISTARAAIEPPGQGGD